MASSMLRVEKQCFTLSQFTTQGGKTLQNVQIGYETYGTLNARRDNAIVIAHYFSGSSHAAGFYRESDTEPGYWDAIIGPGKAIDTDRYFVIASDSLCNLNPHNPDVITTGPMTINPETGKPYGMTFPVVTIRDFVEVQKKLIESMGIEKLYAVAGPSMGSMQAIEWAAAYPECVDRTIAVISGGLETHPYVVAVVDGWASPIRQDPNWLGGDYYGKSEPKEGVVLSLMAITLSALAPAWANRLFGRRPAVPSRDPAQAIEHRFAVEDSLATFARSRSQYADANSLLYLVKAVQLFAVGERGRKIRGKVLFVPVNTDTLMLPEYSEMAAAQLRAQGVQAECFTIDGRGGHLDGLFHIDRASDAIRKFLSSDACSVEALPDNLFRDEPERTAFSRGRTSDCAQSLAGLGCGSRSAENEVKPSCSRAQ